MPLGFWVQDLFDLSRNHYDRIGHFAQGFIPAIAVREIYKRSSPVKGGPWLAFMTVATCLAISASYEFVEWWVAVAAGVAADEFLATQGDVWDTQWDMFLARLRRDCGGRDIVPRARPRNCETGGAMRRHLRIWLRRTITYKWARRIVVAVIGGSVFLIGIAMIILPGPAIVVVPLGLGILGPRVRVGAHLAAQAARDRHRRRQPDAPPAESGAAAATATATGSMMPACGNRPVKS